MTVAGRSGPFVANDCFGSNPGSPDLPLLRPLSGGKRKSISGDWRSVHSQFGHQITCKWPSKLGSKPFSNWFAKFRNAHSGGNFSFSSFPEFPIARKAKNRDFPNRHRYWCTDNWTSSRHLPYHELSIIMPGREFPNSKFVKAQKSTERSQEETCGFL